MNKQDLVSTLAEKADLSKVDASKVLESVIDIVIDTLKGGGEVALSGFGTFKAVQKKARTGRNPKTGAAVNIPAKTSLKFKPSKSVKLA